MNTTSKCLLFASCWCMFLSVFLLCITAAHAWQLLQPSTCSINPDLTPSEFGKDVYYYTLSDVDCGDDTKYMLGAYSTSEDAILLRTDAPDKARVVCHERLHQSRYKAHKELPIAALEEVYVEILAMKNC